MDNIGFDPARYRAAVDIWNDVATGTRPRDDQRKFFTAWDEWLRDNQGAEQHIEPPDVSTLEPEPEPPSEISEIFKGWRAFLK
jgi:hypothetical protein